MFPFRVPFRVHLGFTEKNRILEKLLSNSHVYNINSFLLNHVSDFEKSQYSEMRTN